MIVSGGISPQRLYFTSPIATAEIENHTPLEFLLLIRLRILHLFW
ncbi:MAG: hypothetical protein ACP5RH_09905 [Leptodesmis sp.]